MVTTHGTPPSNHSTIKKRACWRRDSQRWNIWNVLFCCDDNENFDTLRTECVRWVLVIIFRMESQRRFHWWEIPLIHINHHAASCISFSNFLPHYWWSMDINIILSPLLLSYRMIFQNTRTLSLNERIEYILFFCLS